MKKIIVIISVILIILSNIMPAMAFKETIRTSSAPPAKPYEKVVAKDGNWLSERVSYDRDSSLVTGFMGDYVSEPSNKENIFRIKEETVLTNISIPFMSESVEPVTIRLQDDKGNIYDNLRTQKIVNEAIKGNNDSENTISPDRISYVYNSDGNIVLPKGEYTMTLGGSEEAVGPFIMKGINNSGYDRYKEDIVNWESKNNSELSESAEKFKTVGNENFNEKDLDKNNNFEYEPTQIKNPMAFSLDSEYMIDEIIINTYNKGKGQEPGVISIFNGNNELVFSSQSYGGSLGDLANGVWKVSPGIVFESGNYFINIDNPDILTYDAAGDPMFYVNASIPISIRYDFTGTYSINLDSYKTRTLMGAVSSQDSSFSLKDFELTVLDKEGQIELIGKYQDMPFSQGCEMVEENENSIIAKFDFAADLTKLPYKAKISADAMITLVKPVNGDATISIEGIGNFKREASAEKGADDNDYSLVSNGFLKNKELPIFVMTALGKSSDAGNIPGPDNATQAATGLLFPPLVGLVVSSLQDALKPKTKAKAKTKNKPEVRDKAWYVKNNPGKTDEQIAMIMLADAMGGTDNPDEGDAISVGDNEKPGGSDYEGTDGSNESDGYEEDSGYDNDEGSDYENANPEQPETEKELDPQQKPEPEPEKPEKDEIPKQPEEPEEMVLKTSANGATSRYVKDPNTGEWVNAETGGVLDYEKYKENSGKQFADDKKFNDEQFEKSSKGETEHDKIVRDEMQKIKQEEAKVAHQNDMKSKYGTDDLDEIDRIIYEKAAFEKKSFDMWQKIGNFNEAGEIGAKVVGAISDTAIDGLSTVVPGGNYVKAGYKLSKGIAGTMAEKGMNKGSFLEGTIKGATDAVTDSKYLGNNPLKKALVIVAGEAVGSAAGAANRPKGTWTEIVKAGTQGAMDGLSKATIGAVTDKLAGDGNIVLPKGATNILPTMKSVIINKTSLTKIGSGLTDEFIVKPKILDPIKIIATGK